MPLIRVNRESIDDRFSVLGFTVRTESPLYEVGIATDPSLFRAENRTQRNRRNFNSSRSSGALRAQRGEAVYLVPPDVLANFVGQKKLYFGLATYRDGSGGVPDFVQSPSPGHMYVDVSGLTERGLRRLAGRPSGNSAYGNPGNSNGHDASLDWGGDAQPQTATATGAAPAANAPAATSVVGSPTAATNGKANGKANGAAASAIAGSGPSAGTSTHYDDGFGTFPAAPKPGSAAVANRPDTIAHAAKAAAVAAQAFAAATAHAQEADDSHGIEGPIPDDDATAEQQALRAQSLDTFAPEYPGASRFAPAHASNYQVVRSKRDINEIVIHITDGGSKITGTIGWFQNPNQRNMRNEPIHVSAHYVVGRDGEVVQMVHNNDLAWHANAANAHSIGIEHVANTKGLVPTDDEYRGSAGLVAWLCNEFNLPIDRTHVLGHAEADPHTSHSDCPNAVWDWEKYMGFVQDAAAALASSAASSTAPATSQSLGLKNGHAGTQEGVYARAKSANLRSSATIKTSAAHSRSLDAPEVGVADIKLRLFIPSPAIHAFHTPGHPLEGRAFAGDGRSFQENGGTSRAEIHARFEFARDGGKSSLKVIDRHWGESAEYNVDDTDTVDGKPDWWLAIKPGATPIDSDRLGLTDDNLSISMGGTDYSENIASLIDNAAVIGLHVDGGLPLMWEAANIDANLNLHLETKGDRMMARVTGTHDGFPAYELYVNSKRLYFYDPVAAGASPLSLIGAGQFDVQVQTASVDIGPATEWHVVGPVHIKGAAQSLSFQSFALHWDDTPYQPQSNGNVCWAAAAAMVVGWRDRVCIPDEEIAAHMPAVDAYRHGLAPSDRRLLADVWNLMAEPPASYSIEGFRQMLADYGPLYIGMNWDKQGGGHARVLVGMESGGADDGSDTTMFLYDPWPETPGRIRMPFNEFVPLYEGRMTAKGGVVDAQILHADSAQGRAPATAAPFSLSLSASQVRAPGECRSSPGSQARETTRGRASTRALGDEPIEYPVELVPQTNKLACWAASMAMLLSFRSKASVDPERLANEVGGSLMTSYGWDLLQAVRNRYGFVAIDVPSNTSLYFSPVQWAQWLRDLGPLWVVIVGMPHAVVVSGLRGNTADAKSCEVKLLNPWDTRVAFDDDSVAFHPANQGYADWLPFQQFASDFGNMAESDYGNWRVLHLPAQAAQAAQAQALAAGGSTPGNTATTPGHHHKAHRKPPPHPVRAQALDDAAVADEPIEPTRVTGTTMRRQRGNRGRVTWALDQLDGVKQPDPGAAMVPALVPTTITLDDWPCLGTDVVPLPLTVRFDAGGGAVGNVRIIAGTPADVAYDVTVTATINDESNVAAGKLPTQAALNVIIDYDFSGVLNNEASARVKLRLLGNGRYDLDSTWR